MTALHLFGAAILAGIVWRSRWEERHPRISPPKTLAEAAHRIECAWWTRREQRLNQVCAARVIAREPDRSWFWAYVDKKQRQGGRRPRVCAV